MQDWELVIAIIVPTVAFLVFAWLWWHKHKKQHYESTAHKVCLKKSNDGKTKYTAVIDGKKTVKFGQAGASDYTKHKDKARMGRYNNRHKNKENWGDISSRGAWAKGLLWNKPTLKESKESMANRFGITWSCT